MTLMGYKKFYVMQFGKFLKLAIECKLSDAAMFWDFGCSIHKIVAGGKINQRAEHSR